MADKLSELKDIKTKLDAIAKTSGKIAKKELISKTWNEQNELLNNLLVFLLDTNIVTNIAVRKLNKLVEIEVNEDYPKDLNELLVMLQDGASGTDYRIAQIQKYINTLPVELTSWMRELTTKKYKIGATAKSLNEAVGEDIIPIFSCQLAHPFEKVIGTHEKLAEKNNETFVVAATLKLDGFRCICEVRGLNDIVFKTRKGKVINDLNELSEAVNNSISFTRLHVAGFEPFVLDGELLASNGDWGTTSTLASTDGVKTDLNFHVFDALPLHDFVKGESELGYMERQTWLDDFFERCVDSNGLLKKVDVLRIGTPQECIDELMPWVSENNYEGLMFNTVNGKYVAKRTKDLMKVKEFKTNDLLVLDVFEGSGSFSNTLGGVVVDYKGYRVKVGTGFNQNQRELYWKDPSRIIGKIIEVQCFSESTNSKDDGLSMRFPSFKGVRYDKTAKDISYES